MFSGRGGGEWLVCWSFDLRRPEIDAAAMRPFMIDAALLIVV